LIVPAAIEVKKESSEKKRKSDITSSNSNPKRKKTGGFEKTTGKSGKSESVFPYCRWGDPVRYPRDEISLKMLGALVLGVHHSTSGNRRW